MKLKTLIAAAALLGFTAGGALAQMAPVPNPSEKSEQKAEMAKSKPAKHAKKSKKHAARQTAMNEKKAPGGSTMSTTTDKSKTETKK